MKNSSGGPVWLTVKEYAAARRISTQAVYKQLSSGLQPYCKREDGRTLIHSDALTEQPLQPEFATKATTQPEIANRLQTAAEAAALAEMRAEIDRRTAEAETVRAELEAVRADRERLAIEAAAARAAADAEARRAQAAEERAARDAEQLAALAAALQTAQKQAADLTAALTAAQALHAGTIRGQIESGSPSPTGGEQASAADAMSTTASAAAEPERPAASQGAQPTPRAPLRSAATGSKREPTKKAREPDGGRAAKRGGLFSRLFRR